MNGELLREIESGDGVIFAERGVPLDFEDVQPGHDIAGEDDEEPCFVFDDEDLDEYNSMVGFPIGLYQERDSGWNTFHLKNQSHPNPKKPWWRFW